MNILLDTHIAVWAITDDPRLTAKARNLLLDPSNNIFISAVSTLEVNNKRKSKSNNLEFTTEQFIESCEEAGYIELGNDSPGLDHVSRLYLPLDTFIYKFL